MATFIMLGFLIGGISGFALSEMGYSNVVCISHIDYEMLLEAKELQDLLGGKDGMEPTIPGSIPWEGS